MLNKELAINLWQVISFVNNKEHSTFYKTVLLNKKIVAIKIDNKEFKQLANLIWNDHPVTRKSKTERFDSQENIVLEN
ncbi:MAG: hypothetical protein ACO1N7_11115 [Sphingobacteriaceae bacterium]